MRPLASLAILACAAALLGGCGTRYATQGMVTETTTGKKLEFFRYEDAWNTYGLKEAGEGGDTIVEPAWSGYTWGGGVIYVQPTGAKDWVRVLGDGKLTDDRWDSVACYGQEHSLWVRKRGNVTSITDLALEPTTLRKICGPPRELLEKSKTWTPANLANIGTQGYILRLWKPLDDLVPEIGKIDQPAAEKAWFFDTYALMSNLALQTYYHTEDMKYTNNYFGGYVKSMHRVGEAYTEAIRHNAGADKALEMQMRRNRIVAIFTVMSYDKEPVGGKVLEKLVELANEDFTALEADPANASMIAAYTAELQKLIAKRSR